MAKQNSPSNIRTHSSTTLYKINPPVVTVKTIAEQYVELTAYFMSLRFQHAFPTKQTLGNTVIGAKAYFAQCVKEANNKQIDPDVLRVTAIKLQSSMTGMSMDVSLTYQEQIGTTLHRHAYKLSFFGVGKQVTPPPVYDVLLRAVSVKLLTCGEEQARSIVTPFINWLFDRRFTTKEKHHVALVQVAKILAAKRRTVIQPKDLEIRDVTLTACGGYFKLTVVQLISVKGGQTMLQPYNLILSNGMTIRDMIRQMVDTEFPDMSVDDKINLGMKRFDALGI